MEFLDTFDPNNLIKDGLKSLGVPAFLIFLLAAWWFVTAWIEQVKKLTATGQRVGKALRSAARHVGSYRPRTLLGKIPLTLAVGGFQLLLAVVLYTVASLWSVLSDATGRYPDFDEGPPAFTTWSGLVWYVLRPDWLTGTYVVLMALMLWIAYRREPRRFPLMATAAGFAAPASIIVLPLALCSPCLVPYALFEAKKETDMYEVVGESPEAARAAWWSQNGWMVVLIGVLVAVLLLSWVALRLSSLLKDTWLEAPDGPPRPNRPDLRPVKPRRKVRRTGPAVYDPQTGQWI
ncbi:hypothetical protein [Glycomyces sp. NPDC048151]|uniref:hypothetical protein n=1 Tax=Glycomyces sp. NPDC048151 TaxID=3364002 RepID=UPI00371B0C44